LEQEVKINRYSLLSYSNAFFGPFFSVWLGMFLKPFFENHGVIIASIIFIVVALICSTHVYGVTRTSDLSGESGFNIVVGRLWHNISGLFSFCVLMAGCSYLFPSTCSVATSAFGSLTFLWWNVATFIVIFKWGSQANE